MEIGQTDTDSNVCMVSDKFLPIEAYSCLVTKKPKMMLGWRGRGAFLCYIDKNAIRDHT